MGDGQALTPLPQLSPTLFAMVPFIAVQQSSYDVIKAAAEQRMRPRHVAVKLLRARFVPNVTRPTPRIRLAVHLSTSPAASWRACARRP